MSDGKSSKPPTRARLLDDQLILKLFGPMIDKYGIADDDLQTLARRAREIWPKFQRQVALDDCARRAIGCLLSGIDSALFRLSKSLGGNTGALDSTKSAIHREVHQALRGHQDAVSGIMEVAIIEREHTLREESAALVTRLVGGSHAISKPTGNQGGQVTFTEADDRRSDEDCT